MSTTTAIPVSLVLPHITLAGHIRHDRGAGTLDLLDEEGVERLSTDLSVYGCVAGIPKRSVLRQGIPGFPTIRIWLQWLLSLVWKRSGLTHV